MEKQDGQREHEQEICVSPELELNTLVKVLLIEQGHPGKGWRFFHLIEQVKLFICRRLDGCLKECSWGSCFSSSSLRSQDFNVVKNATH